MGVYLFICFLNLGIISLILKEVTARNLNTNLKIDVTQGMEHTPDMCETLGWVLDLPQPPEHHWVEQQNK